MHDLFLGRGRVFGALPLTESVCREVTILGEDACRAAAALIQKVVDRMADDVSVAAQLAEPSSQRAC